MVSGSDKKYFPANSNYNNNTNLLDIDPLHYGGVLIGNSDSLDYFPNNLETQIRKLYADYGSKLIEDPTIINWKKFLLLSPIILNNTQNNSSQRKKMMRSNIKNLMENNWVFKLGDFGRRKDKNQFNENNNNNNNNNNIKNKNVMKKLIKGEISKAFKSLKSEYINVSNNQDTLINLKSKFPDKCLDEINPNEIDLVNNFDINSQNDISKLIITPKEIEDVLIKSHKLIKPGLDKLRMEHIISLWSPYKNSAYKERFQFSFTAIINKIAEGDVPNEISHFFRDI